MGTLTRGESYDVTYAGLVFYLLRADIHGVAGLGLVITQC